MNTPILSKCVALAQFLLLLGGCNIGGTTFSDRILSDGDDLLRSKAHVQDGVARFQCEASDSGRCHYTLYPADCADKDCADAPIRTFTVARGDSRQIVGLAAFRLCVGTDDVARGPDCQPTATPKAH